MQRVVSQAPLLVEAGSSVQARVLHMDINTKLHQKGAVWLIEAYETHQYLDLFYVIPSGTNSFLFK
jgi:hypothetical protein